MVRARDLERVSATSGALGAAAVSSSSGAALPRPESHGSSPAPAATGSAHAEARPFGSLLFPHGAEPGEAPSGEAPAYASDLRVDQIVLAVAGDREEHERVTALLYQRVGEVDTAYFRQEVFRDLEDRALKDRLADVVGRLADVRAHLDQLARMRCQQQRQGWFLDAAVLYLEALASLADGLHRAPVASRALVAFRSFLAGYIGSEAFATLVAETGRVRQALSEIRYCVLIHEGRVGVRRYEGEADYSVEVVHTFARFAQGDVTDHRVRYRSEPGMNHVGEHILERVARLFPEEFAELSTYCQRHQRFYDETVRQFERDVQFYLAYLEYLEPLRSAGLDFCYPELTRSASLSATDTFDLALARKLVAEAVPVVRNDLHLEGGERIIVVTGPNQGGKTTFARTFGQLHHLAAVGCPVPGTAATIFLGDQIFTHFQREEDLTKFSGKLEDDLRRMREIVQSATKDSVVVMNEIFASTTLHDARTLGKRVLDQLLALGPLCLLVTFVDELTTLGDAVVSMVATIDPDDPVRRTFRVERRPADGLAYALAVAAKYGLTYECLRRRVTS